MKRHSSTPIANPRLQLLAAAGLLCLTVACGPDESQKQAASDTASISDEWQPVTPQEPAAAPTGAELIQAARAEAEAKANAAQKEVAAAAAQVKLEAEAEAKSIQQEAAAKTAAAQAAPNSAPQPPAGMPPELQAFFQKGGALNNELQQISSQLRAAHEKAIKSTAVADKKKALEDAALKELEKISPGIETDWRKLQSLIESLDNNQELASGDPAKITDATKAQFKEMQELSAKIDPLQMKIADIPTIKQLRNAFADAVEAEVAKIEPKAGELQARHQEIAQTLVKMQEEFRAMQQKFSPGPPSVVPQPQPQPPSGDAAAPKQ